jgi:RNA polymerase sigma-70 factor, ECF subfamily
VLVLVLQLLRPMALSSLSSFILLAQEGDRTALSQLTAAVRPLVERQLLRYPLSEEDRHDVVQSTLLQIVRRLSSFRGTADFRTWLFRVTANEALMLMRSQRRHRAHLVQDGDLEELGSLMLAYGQQEDGVDSSAMQMEREGHVRNAMEQLPDHYREVVAAHYHQDLGLHEIADKLSLTESAVRSRLHRARSKLRELLTAPKQRRLLEMAA